MFFGFLSPLLLERQFCIVPSNFASSPVVYNLKAGAWPEVIVWWLLGLAWLFLTIGLVVLTTPFMVLPCTIFPVFVFIITPGIGAILLVTITIWQNLMISFYSPYIDVDGFSTLLGINFLLLAALGTISFLRLIKENFQTDDDLLRKIIKGSSAVFALGILYLAYGSAANGFADAAIYFRNFIGCFFFLYIGLYLGRHMGLHDVFRLWKFLSVFLLVYGGIEFFFTESLYNFINVKSFMAVKQHLDTLSVAEVMSLLTTTLFNTPLLQSFDIESYRMLGPNIHYISYAYLLAISMLIFAMERQPLMAVVCFIFITLIGAKGPFILAAVSLALWCCRRLGYPLHLIPITAVLICVGYVAMGIAVGVSIDDYHILGLLGGIAGFFTNPIGKGFGAGGNLTITSVNWEDFQNAGAATMGLESSVSVALYQWGVGGVAYLTFLMWMWWKVLKRYQYRDYPGQPDFLPFLFSFGFVLANLVFQEEAMSPYAIGFEMFFIGFWISQPSVQRRMLR